MRQHGGMWTWIVSCGAQDWIRRELVGGTRRRRALAGLALLGGGAALAACGPTPGGTSETQSQGPVTIKLSMWDYNPQIVRDNLDTFEKVNPGIKVEGPETGPSGEEYRKRMTTAFLAGERTDAMYMRDEDAAEWAEAKWVLPLDNFPGAKDLTKDEYPFITEQTNYKGKKYGTIYYVGPTIAFYNKELLKQAGFARPPGHLRRVPPAGGADQAPAHQRGGVPSLRGARRDRPGELVPGQREADVRRGPAAHLRQGRPLQGHGGQVLPGLHGGPDLRQRLRRAHRLRQRQGRPTPGAPSTT